MCISEQVKHLKELSDTARANVYSFEALSQSLREAADTIEALFTKLQATNMEQSAEDCGGWISCKYRLPTMEECQKNDCRFILDDGNGRYGGLFDYEKQCFTQFDFWRGPVEDKCAIAWQPLPEPYHEP